MLDRVLTAKRGAWMAGRTPRRGVLARVIAGLPLRAGRQRRDLALLVGMSQHYQAQRLRPLTSHVFFPAYGT